MRRAIFLATLLLLAAPAAAQPGQAPPMLESYRRARDALESGIAALGGDAALRGLFMVRRRMTFRYVDPGQQATAGHQSEDAELMPVSVRSSILAWADYRSGRFVRVERYEDGPGDWFEQSDAGDSAGGVGVGRFRDEPAFFASHAAEDFAALRERELGFFPEYLLRLALERAETLQWIGRVDGSDVVAFAHARGRLMRLSFDASNHRLIAAESLRDHALLGDTSTELRFDDYRQAGALSLPFRFHTRIGGRPSRLFTVEAIDYPPSWDEALFQPPDRRVAIVAPPAEPRLQDLGHGVYAGLGSYNVMFAVFRDFVLLAEAPVGAGFTETVYRLIGSVAPGKPVRVVATHFHSDHIGGIPYAVAQGSPILATADVRPALETALGSRRTLTPTHVAATAPLDFRPVERRLDFDDGRQRVEIYDVGPTPHAAHMLVAYFPLVRTLLVADLWDILAPEQALGGLDAEVLMHRLRRLGVEFDRMVPVHGVPATRAELERGLAIRARYVSPLDVDGWSQAQISSAP